MHVATGLCRSEIGEPKPVSLNDIAYGHKDVATELWAPVTKRVKLASLAAGIDPWGTVPPEERRSMSAITKQRSQQLLVSFAKTVRVGHLRLNLRRVMGRTNQRISASEIGGR
jgi:hypothetical protein